MSVNTEFENEPTEPNPRDLREQLAARNAELKAAKDEIAAFQNAQAKAELDGAVKELGLEGFTFPTGVESAEAVKTFYEANKQWFTARSTGTEPTGETPAAGPPTTASTGFQEASARAESVASNGTPPSAEKQREAVNALINDQKLMNDPRVSVDDLLKQAGITIP